MFGGLQHQIAGDVTPSLAPRPLNLVLERPVAPSQTTPVAGKTRSQKPIYYIIYIIYISIYRYIYIYSHPGLDIEYGIVKDLC